MKYYTISHSFRKIFLRAFNYNTMSYSVWCIPKLVGSKYRFLFSVDRCLSTAEFLNAYNMKFLVYEFNRQV